MAYVALNGAVAFGPTAYKAWQNGWPEWAHLSPPHIETLANRNLPPGSPVYSSGFLSWLTVVPPRTADLANHHPDLHDYVQNLSPNTVLLTNEPLLLTPYAAGPVEHLRRPYPQWGTPAIRPLAGWLESGACTSRYPAAIIIFDWDYLAEDAAEFRQEVQTTCPDLPAETFRHSIVYTLAPPGTAE
jgi:hypothetical protein